MEQNIFVCFSSKQVRFVSWLIKKQLVTPLGCANVEHPLTGEIEMQIQRYEARAFISRIAQLIFTRLLGADGRVRFNRMEQCGMIQQIDKHEAENGSASIIFKV